MRSKFHDPQYAINIKEFDYWSNAAGIIIANMPVIPYNIKT